MKKKGVSPLVATVVLIAIVIIISVLLWFWYNQFIEEQRAKAQTQLSQECVQNTEIQIRSSSCNVTSGNYTLKFEIANTGTSKVTQLLFNIKSESTSSTVESGKVLDAGTSLDMAVIVSEEDLDNELPVEAQIIPAVSSGAQMKYCEEQAEYSTISC